jgi:hypothetical protein
VTLNAHIDARQRLTGGSVDNAANEYHQGGERCARRQPSPRERSRAHELEA